MSWTLVAGWYFRNHSYGRVEAIHDLYDPRIFGPREDMRCSCGKYDGAKHEGILCDACMVRVAKNSALLRRTRCGHIKFPHLIEHPLFDTKTTDTRQNVVSRIPEILVAPISFRVDENLKPNALGRRYETLVEQNAKATAEMPADETSLKSWWSKFDRGPLLDAFRAVVGFAELSSMDDRTAFQPDTVSQAALVAISHVDVGAASLLRSMGFSLRLDETI